MIVDVNATLLVQVLHFWVAYFILTKILLKPLFAFISSEEEHDASVERHIKRVAESVALKSAQNAGEWLAMQKELQEKQPTLVVATVSCKQYDQAERVFDKQEITQLAAQASLELVKRVGHDQCH